MILKTTLFFNFLFLFLFNHVNAQNFEWGFGTGSTGFDQRTNAAVNELGEVISVGSFHGSVNFNPMGPALMWSSMGEDDIYIEKRASNGDLIWIKFIGGMSYDVANSVTVDADGNINVLGRFYNTVDFDPSIDAIFEMNGGATGSLFLMQISATGEFVWAQSIAGDFSLSSGESMTVNSDNDIIITGTFKGAVDFDPSDSDAIETVDGTYKDAFIAKYNSSGEFSWVDVIEGNNFKFINQVTTDNAGQIYVAGSYKNKIDLDPSADVEEHINPSDAGNGFIVKLNETGEFLWGGVLISDLFSSISAIKVEGDYIVIAGTFEGITDFDFGEAIQTRNAHTNLYNFIQKLNTEGEFTWLNVYTAAGAFSSIKGLEINSFEDIIVTGTFSGDVDFDPSWETEIRSTTGLGDQDGFIHQVSAEGEFERVYVIGGELDQTPYGIAMGSLNELFVYGLFRDEIVLETGVTPILSHGEFDFFLMKLGEFSSVNSNKTQTSFNFYPNPAKEFITVNKLVDETITIENVSGENVISVKPGQTTELINVSALSKGVYIIRVSNTEGVKIKKLVIS